MGKRSWNTYINFNCWPILAYRRSTTGQGILEECWFKPGLGALYEHISVFRVHVSLSN